MDSKKNQQTDSGKAWAKTTLLARVKKKKLRYCGHIIGHNCLEKDVIVRQNHSVDRYLRFSYFRNICQKFKFVPISTSKCKIWWRSDDPRQSYCISSIFKMAAVHHLRFSHFPNICQKFKCAPITTSIRKIWWRSDDPRPSYCVFSIFKMAAIHQVGFGMTS